LSAAKRTRDEAISLCAGYEEYLSAREKENMDLTWRELDHAIEMQAEEEQKKNDPEHKPSKKMCPSFEALARLWAPSSLPWSDADMLRASAVRFISTWHPQAFTIQRRITCSVKWKEGRDLKA
ncbi:hypothetical protein CYMTET_34441, partial [Cymbomonas tetramitiformis]